MNSGLIGTERGRPSFDRNRPARRARLQTARLAALAVACAACGGSVSPGAGDGMESMPAGDDDARPDVNRSAPTSTGPSALAQRVARASASADALRGGRLYDNFYSENTDVDFAPDDAASAGDADGQGGPLGDGTLPDGAGEPVLNDSGHAYRMKNFFGWDLRGADGVYGPDYQDKAYVAPYNLLAAAARREDVTRLIVDGAPGLPAFGAVMPEQDLADVVAFVMAVREHQLPRPDDIWSLDRSAPNGYVLAPGADVESGQRAIASSCGRCHGADGTSIMFDDGEHSLGTLARASAYEVWFKIVAGNPGSPMGSQVPPGEPGEVQAQMVLDVIAALCDQGAFPAGGATEPDVPSGDPRCGDYLR
jgi:mono/diheme cytochrome c family protein